MYPVLSDENLVKKRDAYCVRANFQTVDLILKQATTRKLVFHKDHGPNTKFILWRELRVFRGDYAEPGRPGTEEGHGKYAVRIFRELESFRAA